MIALNTPYLGESPYQALLSYNERILKNWIQLETSVYTDSSLSFNLLEEVRKTLLQGNQFDYCKVVGRRPGQSRADRRVHLATAFAELFLLDHTSIYIAHFKVLEEEFSKIEISELCSFITLNTATQKLGCIFNLKGESQQVNAATLEEVKMNFNM